jgi:hypothetical protein
VADWRRRVPGEESRCADDASIWAGIASARRSSVGAGGTLDCGPESLTAGIRTVDVTGVASSVRSTALVSQLYCSTNCDVAEAKSAIDLALLSLSLILSQHRSPDRTQLTGALG